MFRIDRKSDRISLIITLLLVMSFALNGQQLNSGIFVGINASQVSGDSYQGFNKLGWTLGLFMNRQIAYNINWQAEVKYGTRGVYKAPSDMDQTLYRSSYHVLELPLSVHYLYNEKMMLELGTSPELLVTAFFWDEGGLLDRSSYPENRRFGMSVFAGLGYWFSDRMMAGLRYTNSAIPFRDPEEWNNPQYRGLFHNVISFTIAYRLNQK
jgi:hypothetical protein